MIIAWLIEGAERCPDCGTYYDEWDPAKGGHVHAFYARAQHCLGCKAKADLYQATQENGRKDESVTNGLQVRLEKNPDSPRLRSPATGNPITPVRQ